MKFLVLWLLMTTSVAQFFPPLRGLVNGVNQTTGEKTDMAPLVQGVCGAGAGYYLPGAGLTPEEETFTTFEAVQERFHNRVNCLMGTAMQATVGLSNTRAQNQFRSMTSSQAATGGVAELLDANEMTPGGAAGACTGNEFGQVAAQHRELRLNAGAPATVCTEGDALEDVNGCAMTEVLMTELCAYGMGLQLLRADEEGARATFEARSELGVLEAAGDGKWYDIADVNTALAVRAQAIDAEYDAAKMAVTEASALYSEFHTTYRKHATLRTLISLSNEFGLQLGTWGSQVATLPSQLHFMMAKYCR